MTNSLKILRETLAGVLAEANLDSLIAPDLQSLDTNLAGLESTDGTALFKTVAGSACPDWLRPQLALPDSLNWSLRAPSLAWEASLVHPLILLNRTVDANYANCLSELGEISQLILLDETANVTAPSMVLLNKKMLDDPKLSYFDTREFSHLDMAADDYLGLLAESGGVDGWQLAFCDLAITPDRRKRLTQSLQWLENNDAASSGHVIAAIKKRLG